MKFKSAEAEGKGGGGSKINKFQQFYELVQLL